MNVHGGLVFRRMVSSGVIKEDVDGRFWLDQAEYEASRRRGLRNVAIAVTLVAVACAILYFTR